MGIIVGLLVFILLAQLIDGRAAFAFGLVVSVVAFVLLKRRSTRMALGQMGFSPEEAALIWEDQARGDHEGSVRRIEAIQAKRRQEFRKATGIDVEAIVPEIGRDISWSDIVRHIFRVREFDRTGTTIGPEGQVYPSATLAPTGISSLTHQS